MSIIPCMNGKEFQPGDVVELKSGGPMMTVDEYGTFGMGTNKGFMCIWFEGTKRKGEVFAPHLLKKVE